MHSKRIVRAAALLALALAVILAQTAGAGGFHFNSLSFKSSSPLRLEGILAGLGNTGAGVTLTGYGTVTAMCENKGGNQAPGRNPLRIEVAQTVFVPLDSFGRASVEVAVKEPALQDISPSPTSKTAGCPNNNWVPKYVIDSSTKWTAARVAVTDTAGQTQIDLYCTWDNFTNGVATNVSCVEN